MIHYKTDKEIDAMREGGIKLKHVIRRLIPDVAVGMSTDEIDRRAEQYLKEEGAEPSFKRVKGYRWTTCLPVNSQVVHTPPSQYRLKKGDVLTIDIGAYYKGLHTDYATTFIVGSHEDDNVRAFLQTGEEALKKAIQVAKAGDYIGTISQAIEETIVPAGYFIMKQLTGHGIGRELHEDPFVPGFLQKPVAKTLRIKPGLVLAVEVIYSMGTNEIAYEQADGWSITTKDGSLSACYEHTIAITDKNTYILT